jgi:hypothetical protein
MAGDDPYPVTWCCIQSRSRIKVRSIAPFQDFQLDLTIQNESARKIKVRSFAIDAPLLYVAPSHGCTSLAAVDHT